LDAAVAGYRESHVRARVRSQIKLASLVMVTGDPTEATVLGTQRWTPRAPCDPAAPPTTCAASANPTNTSPR